MLFIEKEINFDEISLNQLQYLSRSLSRALPILQMTRFGNHGFARQKGRRNISNGLYRPRMEAVVSIFVLPARKEWQQESSGTLQENIV